MTALLGAVASGACAADKAKPAIDFTVRAEPTATAPANGQVLKWDARKGHWGLTLNLQQLDTRETNWNDVQAGAYYKVTPQLRVGGAVAIGDQQVVPSARKPDPADGAPRVRLETAFKF
jgi:hypothetical protein